MQMFLFPTYSFSLCNGTRVWDSRLNHGDSNWQLAAENEVLHLSTYHLSQGNVMQSSYTVKSEKAEAGAALASHQVRTGPTTPVDASSCVLNRVGQSCDHFY